MVRGSESGISIPGSPRRRRALHFESASMVMNRLCGWQPRGTGQRQGKTDLSLAWVGGVGHRRCSEWSGYARQSAIMGAAEVSCGKTTVRVDGVGRSAKKHF